MEIFSNIRDLDERYAAGAGALREEIGDVTFAMLDADYLGKVRQKPYEQAKADMTFYAPERGQAEVKNALNSG